MMESSSKISTRRQFCTHACQLASLTAAALLLNACGSNPTSPSDGGLAPTLPTVSGSVSGRTISVAITASSALASVGSAAMVSSSLGTYLLARVAQDTFTALTATCTHESRTVTGFTDGHYVCQVHGSQFSTSGAVLAGPAGSPLRQYATSFANEIVSFTV